MVLVSSRKLLVTARRNSYAVGAFNVNNLETLQAVIHAAETCKSPVIVQTSEGAIQYAGLSLLSAMILTMARNSPVPVAVHLDHGKSIGTAKQCLDQGYTSVMIDASHEQFNNNVRVTQAVVKLCKKYSASVEAELGTIGGAEDAVSSKNIILTDPDAAEEFVKKTRCDALAVALGTSHGSYKFEGKPKIELELLKKISARVRIPLVLHGASSVPAWLVGEANKYGADLQHVNGVPEIAIQKAISLGIAKINTDTDLRIAFDAGIRKYLTEQPSDIDPRHCLSHARDLMQRVVEHRMKLFGSEGKAKRAIK